jgi:signal peptidase I
MNPSSFSTAAGHSRHPVWAVLLSIAATGLGHIYCGRLLKGLVLFFASFAFAPIIVTAARNAASPLMLTLVVVSLLLLLGIFVYAIIDAGMLARKIGNGYQLKEYNRWCVYLLFIVVALSYPTNLASSIRDNIMQAYKIPSQSMAPGILPGDRVLLDKTRYRTQSPRRGDVVIFVYPDDRRFDYVKRIVALPGESVEIRDDVVYVNDRPFSQYPVDPEPGLDFSPNARAGILTEDNGINPYPIVVDDLEPYSMKKTVVPHGYCFVLSDNRQPTGGGTRHFGDSRHFGPVPLADIKGRLAYIYWPAHSWSRFGTYNH